MPSDSDPFTLTKRQPNPVDMKLSRLSGPRRRPDPISSPLKGELALWRAFLGDEIDAILRDKD